MSFRLSCKVFSLVKIAVKESLAVVHEQVHNDRKLLHAIRASIKRRDMYVEMKLELDNSNAHLPILNADTQWLSTFRTIKSAYRSKCVLNAV